MTDPFADVERRAAAAWAAARAYELDAAPGAPKFLATYPYSYMNAFAHVGHAFTMSRVDFFVRYQRMLGKRALFPFGYHATGTPIVAAANRVREGEEKQIRILKMQGFTDEDVRAFADPLHWIRFFPKEWRKDVDRLGLAIDWRREFHTTDLNPHYDAFIRWQFRRLREGGYVDKGRHPVMWCPKDRAPVADHDRHEGEGETPQEWTVYKMEVQGPDALALPGTPPERVYLLAATLRPDTVFGQTNAWVDPLHEYVPVRVGREWWIINATAASDLHHQVDGAEPRPDRKVIGARLVGMRVRAAGTGAIVPVLPAAFIRHEKGTGIVTSVPSDSPQDLLSLRAVQDGAIECPPGVRDASREIAIVPVIRTAKYGTESADRAVTESGARDHRDAAAIAEATEKAYQAGFYGGVMLENAGPFAGRPVAEAKDAIRGWLVERGEAIVHYWPSGPVVCRCLTPSVVRIVSDQWFLKYGDPEWKALAQRCLDGMKLYPEQSRKQFNHVIGWLRDWACARESGLGTRLPWDEKWVIESLSDSTIYNAYYTFSHLIEPGTVTGGGSAGRAPGAGVAATDLTDAFFDHVLLGRGTAEAAARGTVTVDVVERARREFAYWYPLDFRNSGKDLVQNHLTFLVFNHVAIWKDQPEMWPRGMAVNGWVNVDGEKMSKSRGNFILLRDALDAYGTTATRLAVASAGEGLDDANFDREFATSVARRVDAWLELARGTGLVFRDERLPVDDWFASALHRHVAAARDAYDEASFRTALRVALFDAMRDWQWYVKRSAGTPHRGAHREFVDVVNRLLTPLMPHVAEEIHHVLGRPGLAIDARFPEVNPAAINPAAETAERYVKSVLDDAKEILKVTGIAPKDVALYTAPAWKRAALARAIELAASGPLNPGALIKDLMQIPDVKPFAKDVPKFAGDLSKTLATMPRDEVKERASVDERKALEAAAPFLSRELGGALVRVHAADEPGLTDPTGKARFATPGRPAIYVA